MVTSGGMFSTLLGSEGDFHDMRTLEPVDFMSIPWRIETEPTGYRVENCTGEQCQMSQPMSIHVI